MAFATKLTTNGAHGALRRERVHGTLTLAGLVEVVASESRSAAELVTVMTHRLRSRRVTWCEAPAQGWEGGIA